ncbi:MAG: hypothetical protein DHS20C14_00430 [Phycisphaeraceae bacterium]|nr:MAG: hypothetical protein DHS20C14_00430 [Phycisphaeraceae bacterium]
MFFYAVAASVAVVAGAGPSAGEAARPRSVELVSAFTLDQPPTLGERSWPFGGISGIDAFSEPGRSVEVYAVSDDRAEFAPARMAHLVIPGIDTPTPSDSATVEWVALTDEYAEAFKLNRVDPEGVRAWREQESVFWSSEGRTKEGEPPAVFARDSGGRTVRLPVPEMFIADAQDATVQAKGVRNNRGFEALALEVHASPHTCVLYAGVEEPLAQDESDTAVFCRVIRYQLSMSGTLADELLVGGVSTLRYPLGPVPGSWAGEQNGLTELVSVGEGRLLALERAERVGEGAPQYNVRLYLVEVPKLPRVTERRAALGRPADQDSTTMQKCLLFDFDAVACRLPGGRPMNFEGMTILPDGSLLVCSDNDHGAEGPTVFVRLRLD